MENPYLAKNLRPSGPLLETRYIRYADITKNVTSFCFITGKIQRIDIFIFKNPFPQYH